MTGRQPLPVVLLLGLPASGKSEVRRFLDAGVGDRALPLGPLVHIDDYPYVHLMRRIDESLRLLDAPPAFFDAPDGRFIEPRDWGALIHLIDDDFRSLSAPPSGIYDPVASTLARLDAARRKVGAPPVAAALESGIRAALGRSIARECAEIEGARTGRRISGGETVVIEFARGGPAGAEMPLPEPFGYRYSLAQLDETVLDVAGILYVWTTPEESRRRNRERARPGPEGDASILHHGVPERVMLGDYGSDDLLWLREKGGGRVRVERGDRTWSLPAAVLDNRVDHTSFIRQDPSDWAPEAVGALQTRLAAALDELAAGSVSA